MLHRAVAAVGIRVILLHQHAVAFADRLGFGAMRQAHFVERPDLQTGTFAHPALAGVRRGAVVEPFPSAPTTRIVELRGSSCGADRTAAEPPGRLVAEAGRSLEGGDFRLGHTFEK